MDKKTLLAEVLAFGWIGLKALGIWLFNPVAGLHGTAYAEPRIRLTRQDGSTFAPVIYEGISPYGFDIPAENLVHDLKFLLQ